MPGSFRLFCALLTLLLALPAMQANACLPSAPGNHAAHRQVQAHGDHGRHQDHQAPAPAHGQRHDCVGCIPPIDIGAYRPVARLSLAFMREAASTETAFSAGRSAPPEPPPPRITV